MGIRLSLDAKLYYGTAGSSAATELKTAQDCTLKLKKGEAKISSRASYWALVKGTLKEAEFDFTVIDDSTDTACNDLVTAWINNTPKAFLIKDAVDGHGIDADFEIIGCDRNEKLEDAVAYNFTIKPTYVSRYPAWV